MSLAEEMLATMPASDDSSTYLSEDEPHIIIDNSRAVFVPSSLKTIAVTGDKDIETITFDCVRYWDGHDLSTFAIYLNYILPNGDEGTYIPKGISKAEDTFSFDWLIGSEFTYAQGKMTFWIVAKLTDDSGTLIKQWSSLQNYDCTIAQGGDKIYVPEKQTDQDVISQAISISRASAETAEQQANLAKEAAEKAATDAREAAEDEVSRIIGELGVVQELGDSPNSVVSQLKVTKEFNKTNAKINRNSKRITNLEQGLPAEMFETDSTMAYQKDVPENVLPYASINKIGGMTYKSKNLFGGEAFANKIVEFGGYKNESAGTVYLAGGTAEDKIAYTNFKANTQYTFIIKASTRTIGGINLIIKYTDGTGYICQSTAADTAYVWRVVSESGKTVESFAGKWQADTTYYYNECGIFEGVIEQHDFEPFFEGLRSAKVTEVKSVEVNLLHYASNSYSQNGVTVTVNADKSLTIRGTSTTYVWIDLVSINLTAGEQYTAKATNCPSNARFHLYHDEDGHSFRNSAYTFTAAQSKYAFALAVNQNETIDVTVYPMLNKGSTAKPYTPYVEHTLPIPEELRPANGINAEVYDSIEVNENGSVTKRVKCGEVDLGALDWIYVTDKHGNRFQAEFSGGKTEGKVLCAKYKGTTAWTINNTNIDKAVGIEAGHISIRDTSYTDTVTFKSAMSGVMLVYELAEPEVTDISDLLPADNLISVEGGGTLTFENEYGYAVPSEVEYQVEV